MDYTSSAGTGTGLLEEVLRLSTEMLLAADEDNWQRVMEMDTVRSDLLTIMDTSGLQQYEVRTATGLVMSILQTNEKLAHRTEMARTRSGKQLEQLQRGQQAVKAYGEHTGHQALLPR